MDSDEDVEGGGGGGLLAPPSQSQRKETLVATGGGPVEIQPPPPGSAAFGKDDEPPLIDETLEEDDLAFITTELGTSRLRFAWWIEKQKHGKRDKRILVISDQFVFTVKLGLMKRRTVQRKSHMYNLIKVRATEVDQVVLCFKTDGREREFFVDVRSEKSDEIIKVIREVDAVLKHNYPEAYQLAVEVPIDRQLLKVRWPVEQPAANFFVQYRAYCIHEGKSPHHGFIKHFLKVVESGSRDLNLSSWLQDEGIQDTRGISFKAIVMAFRFNSYWRTLAVENITGRKDMLQLFSEIVKCTRHLTHLRLRSVEGTPEGVIAIGDAIGRNEALKLQCLDLSRNRVKDKGASSLSAGLKTKTNGLSELLLSGCQIGTKGLTSLFMAFVAQPAYPKSLQVLSLSHNTMNEAATRALVAFLRTSKSLKTLELAGTSVELRLLARAIIDNDDLHLSSFDISENKIDKNALGMLGEALEKSVELEELSIAQTKCTLELLIPLVDTVCKQPRKNGMRLDISGNPLGHKNISGLAAAIMDSPCLTALNASDCKLSNEGFLAVAKSMRTCERLIDLDLSRNVAYRRDAMSDCIDGIVELLGPGVQCKLSRLALRGDSTNYFGDQLVPLFTIFARNRLLEELDLRGNNLKDNGIAALSHPIAINSTLLTLHLDDNQIGTAGLAELAQMFKDNHTILTLPRPETDFKRMAEGSKPIEVTPDSRGPEDFWKDIEAALQRNRAHVESHRARDEARKLDLIKAEAEMQVQRAKEAPLADLAGLGIDDLVVDIEARERMKKQAKSPQVAGISAAMMDPMTLTHLPETPQAMQQALLQQQNAMYLQQQQLIAQRQALLQAQSGMAVMVPQMGTQPQMGAQPQMGGYGGYMQMPPQ